MTTNKDEKKHAEPTFCQFGSNSRPGTRSITSTAYHLYVLIKNIQAI